MEGTTKGRTPPIGGEGGGGGAGLTVEEEAAAAALAAELVDDQVEEAEPEDEVTALARQRDDYLDALQRLQAEFDNYRKRMGKETADRITSGIGRLAEQMLPVLDACEAAVAHGDDGVEAILGSLRQVLDKAGLQRIDAIGAAFDPSEHEAVVHEPGAGGEQVVTEEMRAGYRWNGRVIRPAMVKVSGG